ncbi:ABC transporter ATP-binding protein [Pleomorphomonas sp. JP5]|uniref:ABC transporter ATP-binding protein n=1 Tax=Pleomorphomonas sp. JP5 TaxID=2942998 RepID=UPI002044AA4F|nr:sn-glycerol-3-phosphate ABC transporter ATP-binding protein UgpC [Pleomorphomonas sp. JP5]MCM5558975.1 sn-glycerol-3-phosphate ABC transporter ATP-binding protein UgpC [Pleomorphomonas sp. JP5]
MANVAIRSVNKYYGAFHALKEINIDIADGDFVVLVGPSGCGKSTLLRMIAGLEDISSGEVEIGGQVINDLLPQERDIAMVFQNYALYPHMTVAENMSFALRLARVPKPERDAKVTRAAAILGLENLLDRRPAQLSGGQRQRVAMGRAIVRDPQVFLFDEPLSNLDAKLRVQMRAEIKELHERLGTTTIYVTHDQIEAMTMADRIVVMQNGEVAQVGAPLDLYDLPRKKFVAGFIGSPAMNFLSGHAKAGHFLTSDGIELPLGPNAAVEGDDLSYGIRPEHLRLGDSGVPMHVTVVEPTGAETQVLGRIGEQPVVCAFRERLDIRPGAVIHVLPDEDKLHIFGKDGHRLN